MPTTPNRAIRYPLLAEVADVPLDMSEMGLDLDAMANISFGTAALRPAAVAGASHAPGSAGWIYVSTDTGAVDISNGVTWFSITTAPGVPLGASLEYGGNGDPADTRYLLEDGRALNRTGTYAALFAVLSTTYGAGNGTTTFNIPDSRGRVTVGPDNMGTAAGAAGRLPSSPNGRGNTGGAELHAHTTPAHSHAFQRDAGLIAGRLTLVNPASVNQDGIGPTDFFNITAYTCIDFGSGGSTVSMESWYGTTNTQAPTTNNTSGMQPYVVKNKIIRVI